MDISPGACYRSGGECEKGQVTHKNMPVPGRTGERGCLAQVLRSDTSWTSARLGVPIIKIVLLCPLLCSMILVV